MVTVLNELAQLKQEMRYVHWTIDMTRCKMICRTAEALNMVRNLGGQDSYGPRAL